MLEMSSEECLCVFFRILSVGREVRWTAKKLYTLLEIHSDLMPL